VTALSGSLSARAIEAMADPRPTRRRSGSSPREAATPLGSLYRTLASPVARRQIGPPDTMLTRTIETIDNDCTVWLFTDASLPAR